MPTDEAPGSGRGGHDRLLQVALAVEHGDAGSNDEASVGLTAGVLSIDITATDFDGDSASASVDLGAIIQGQALGRGIAEGALSEPESTAPEPTAV